MTTSPVLDEIARQVRVAPDRLSATMQGETIEAKSRPRLVDALANRLYHVFHAGMSPLRPGRLRDPWLEKQLISLVPHHSARRRARPGPRPGIVELDGVRIRLPENRIRTGERGEFIVEIPPVRPALSPGFLLVEGSAGSPDPELLRLYVHLADAASALKAWKQVLSDLEEAGIPYRCKVTSHPELYPRRDSLVVYTATHHMNVLTGLAQRVAGLGVASAEVSRFVSRLHDGVGLATEPFDLRPRMRGKSFGTHRSHVIAQVLVDTAGLPSPEQWDAALAEANISSGDLSRNRRQRSARRPEGETGPHE